MNTRETIEAHFDQLSQQGAWQDFFADGVVFTSFATPQKQVAGKDAFLDSTQRFYASIRSVELKSLLVDGQSACALTRYEIGGPNGKFDCHVDADSVKTKRSLMYWINLALSYNEELTGSD